MNKTIIININGQVFHIEEDAYEVLKKYMTGVKQHFAFTPDHEEIIADIENRIAEMFSEILEIEKKQVIELHNVIDVTTQMGKVEDFDAEGEPSVSEFSKVENKLYRDLDDRVIGGVCAGIGHYFNIEARWIRVLAILVVLLAGTGIIIYFILWIIMPPARTRAERMYMKGEAVNLQNIKRNFDEEVDALKHNFSRANTKAKPVLNKVGNMIADLVTFLLNFLKQLFKVLVKIAGSFIMFMGALLLLALIVALFVLLGFFGNNEFSVFPLNAINTQYFAPLALSAFILILIPLIALILFSARVIFNRQILGRNTASAMLVIWITGLIIAGYFGAKLGSEFKEEASFSQNSNIKAADAFYLKINEEKYLSKTDSIEFNIDDERFTNKIIIDRDENDIKKRGLRLYIEKSEGNEASVTEVFSSQGPTYEKALQNARQLPNTFKQSDSVLLFNTAVYLKKNQLWRNQEVNVTLKIPVNKKIFIEGKLHRILNNQNLWHCEPDNSGGNVTSEWIMTNEGLKCADSELYERKTNQ